MDGDVVGLAGFDCGRCSDGDKRDRGCHLDGRRLVATRKGGALVDYHLPPRDADTIHFCPASVPDVLSLQRDVYDLATVKEAGGLYQYYGRPVGDLPEALVSWFNESSDAIERLAAEVRAAGKRAPKPETKTARRR